MGRVDLMTNDATPKKRRSSRHLIDMREGPITVRELHDVLARILATHGDLPVWIGLSTLGHARRVEANRRGNVEWHGVFITDR